MTFRHHRHWDSRCCEGLSADPGLLFPGADQFDQISIGIAVIGEGQANGESFGKRNWTFGDRFSPCFRGIFHCEIQIFDGDGEVPDPV